MALLAGFVLSYGWWGWTLYREFGNPFFPFFNAIFQSPWWEPASLFDRNFGPRTLPQWLFFPLYFAREHKLRGFCFWFNHRNGAAQESNLPSVGLRRRTGFEDQLGHQPQPLRVGH